MARSKWISFTAQQSLNRDAQKSAKPEDTPSSALSVEIKKFGLENFGNTCYANSVLQALYFCAPFRELMLQHPDPSVPKDLNSTAAVNSGPSRPPPLAPIRRKPERKPSSHLAEASSFSSAQPPANPIPSSPPTLFSALRSLFYHISTRPGDKGSVAPKAFIEKLKELNDVFRSTMHQDAHEFLNYLLNQIVEEMDEERRQTRSSLQGEELTASIATLSSKVPTVVTAASSNSGTRPREATLVHKLFEGILTSETRCLTCETVSARDEPFLDLSIDIEQNSSVTACLRHFSASEMLCQKNKFFCDSCCDLQEAEKRMKIKKLPNVLALHLKRFKYQEDVGRYIKLTYRVAFPMELRLFNTVDDIEDADRLYGLFAIVVHIGTGPHQGHYISIIKTGGSWFVFDDDVVYPIAEGDITKYFGDSNSGSAYVLYYQAADLNLAELGLQPPEAVPESSLTHPPVPVQTLAADNIGQPPGLENERTTVDDPTIEPGPAALQQPQLITPDKPSLAVSPIHVTATLGAAEQLTFSTSSTLPSPSTSGFGYKFFSTLRRTPSASLPRSGTTNGNETNRPRSDHFALPSPSLSDKENRTAFYPPPVPPLPPVIQQPAPVNTFLPDEKEKPSKSGGWFLRRKSLRLTDKSKMLTTEKPSPLPPSPSSMEGSVSAPPPSSWFKPFGSSQRDVRMSDSGQSRDASFDSDKSRLENGAGQHLSVNGPNDSPPTSRSTTSSLNSHSPALQPFVRPSISSSSLSKSIPKTSTATTTSSPDRHRPSRVESRKPKDYHDSPNAQKQFPSSSKVIDLERSLPPLPVFVSHVHSPGNGQGFVAESKSLTNGYHRYSEAESSTASTSLTDDMRTHLRSTTLPPSSSIAESPGANINTGSIPSITHGLRKATRKLSLTAPMLGFGRKDKKH